jgi:hypothetical protein
MFESICNRIVVSAVRPKTDHRNLSTPAANAEPIMVFESAKGKVFNRNAAIHDLTLLFFCGKDGLFKLLIFSSFKK